MVQIYSRPTDIPSRVAVKMTWGKQSAVVLVLFNHLGTLVAFWGDVGLVTFVAIRLLRVYRIVDEP